MKVVQHKNYGTVCMYDKLEDIKPMVDRFRTEDEDGWRYEIENFNGGYAIAVFDEYNNKLGLI